MQERAKLTATTLVSVLVLSACASGGKFVSAPQVELGGVEIKSLSFARQTFLLSFNVSNPNPFPLPVKGVHYKVMLQQQQFASGQTPGSFTIPASGDGAFSISVDLDLRKTATRLTSIIGSGMARPVDYELHGSLDVAIPFANSLNFTSSGTIMVQGGAF
jgi:LEA14-like dessication related protein